MIVDKLANAASYRALGPGIAAAFDYLKSQDFSKIPAGKYEIDGDKCFAMVQDYETVRRAEKRWESHRKYIDVQYIANGAEHIGYANLNTLKVVENYDEAKDITWLEGCGDFITVSRGTFVILYPQDAHMPGVAIDGPEPVRKVVVKIAMDDLRFEKR
ncbi:MAG: YhcH/YjgK/YiaL family protein [Armatimonadota bacterium]